MTKEQAIKNAGLAAVIRLAPGGFLLGAALLAKKWRDRKSDVPPAGEPAVPAYSLARRQRGRASGLDRGTGGRRFSPFTQFV